MGVAWSDPTYAAAAALVAKRAALAVPPHRVADFQAAVDSAARASGAPNRQEYVARLEKGLAPIDELVSHFTVGETYFFRDVEQFEALTRHAIPELLARRPPDHLLRVWTAGCATGEEAWSLAGALEDMGIAGRYHVLGTDISRAALGRAQEGVYGEWSLRGHGRSRAERILRNVGGQRWEIERALRQRVRFEYLNLGEDLYPSFTNDTYGLDVIFCRNVLIYFEHDAVAEVARRLYAALAEGGWLVLGASDPPLRDLAPFEVVSTKAGLFYRRGEERPEPKATPLEFLTPKPPQQPRPREERALPTLESAREAYREGAWGEVKRIASRLEDGLEAATLLVRALANLGETEAALRASRAAIKLHPTSAELYLLEASLLLGLNREKQAVDSLRRAIYLDRTLAVAHFTLGTALARAGQLADAQRAYRNAQKLCAALPPDQPLPLGDGEPAGRLRAVAEAQLSLLETGGRR